MAPQIQPEWNASHAQINSSGEGEFKDPRKGHSACLLLLEHGHHSLWANSPNRVGLLGNGMGAGMEKHQALQQQSPPEGSIPQLQPGQLAAGEILHNHALASICIAHNSDASSLSFCLLTCF